MLLKYGEDNHVLDRYIERTQTINECCGYRNYTDWFQSKWAMKHPNRFPESCCESIEAGQECIFGKLLYLEPCKDIIFVHYGRPRIIMKYLSLTKSIITFFGLYYCARLHQASRRPGLLERTIPLFHAPDLRMGVGLANANQQRRNTAQLLSPTPSENARRGSNAFTYHEKPQITLKVWYNPHIMYLYHIHVWIAHIYMYYTMYILFYFIMESVLDCIIFVLDCIRLYIYCCICIKKFDKDF